MQVARAIYSSPSFRILTALLFPNPGEASLPEIPILLNIQCFNYESVCLAIVCISASCQRDIEMRTTVNIDDDVLARELARARDISVDSALSELARRGMSQKVEVHYNPETDLPVLVSPPGSAPMDPQKIRQGD